ncbi:glycerate kinase [Vibrio sp. SS-MA-C1-2]|uniref:glycerate kinase n=1 Tax=Vibrio sp. SS-MA-C1-2 TaxID=2908646 RepID=UPI001F2F3DEF|nr:glycerate kinase [Vibrio sp. SS-MA-C1-2]UJF18425.1 glycerate kinase [Vibrio sp. SS-MA-C1-2]
MKIVIAPDSFKDCLTAIEVASAIEKGFKRILPNEEYIKLPISTHRSDIIQSLVFATNGQNISHQVVDLVGDKIQGTYGLSEDDHIAFIDTTLSNLNKLTPHKSTTSMGVGQQIKDALDKGVKRIVLIINEDIVNDGGIGALQALGMQLIDHQGMNIPFENQELINLCRIDTRFMHPHLKNVTFDLVVNDDAAVNMNENPFQSQNIPDEKEIESSINNNLVNFSHIIKKQFGNPIIVKENSAENFMAGLASILNTNQSSIIDIFSEMFKLDKHIKTASLVITGQGELSPFTEHELIHNVVNLSKKYDTSIVAITGCIPANDNVIDDSGIEAIFSITPRPVELSVALDEAKINIEQTSKSIASLITML